MKVLLCTTPINRDFYDEDFVKECVDGLKDLSPSIVERVSRWGTKFWNIYVEINSLNDIDIIQKYFDEELIIDLRGEEPFIEVYDGYRE